MSLQPAPRDPPTVIIVPEDVVDSVVESMGGFFKAISKTDPKVIASQHLNPLKSIKRAQVLQRYTPLAGKRLLEVGSGFGTNLAVWTKQFNVDGYGIEPSGEGFGASFAGSQKIFVANGLDPTRLISATGEKLPFDDESFDIVYSANVLEHTQDPRRVLCEAVRVLKRGGILHFELPNFLSYFEGHYMVVQPPIFWKPMLSAWVRFVFRRDPAFARTLQTCINPIWCRRAVRYVNTVYPCHLISLGGDVFLERLAKPFDFEMKQVASRLTTIISLVQWLNWGNWIGRLIVGLQGHYPIYLTLRRENS